MTIRRHKTTLLALGTMVAMAGTGLAVAASSSTTTATQATCDALTKQADTALSSHKTEAKYKSAQQHRDAGEKDCKAGSYAKGSEELRRAISDLGMKPVN